MNFSGSPSYKYKTHFFSLENSKKETIRSFFFTLTKHSLCSRSINNCIFIILYLNCIEKKIKKLMYKEKRTYKI